MTTAVNTPDVSVTARSRGSATRYAEVAPATDRPPCDEGVTGAGGRVTRRPEAVTPGELSTIH